MFSFKLKHYVISLVNFLSAICCLRFVNRWISDELKSRFCGEDHRNLFEWHRDRWPEIFVILPFCVMIFQNFHCSLTWVGFMEIILVDRNFWIDIMTTNLSSIVRRDPEIFCCGWTYIMSIQTGIIRCKSLFNFRAISLMELPVPIQSIVVFSLSLHPQVQVKEQLKGLDNCCQQTLREVVGKAKLLWTWMKSYHELNSRKEKL